MSFENNNINSTSRFNEIWLAGGCFWGVEAYMARINGVVDVTAGYANGHTDNPSYQEVCTGKTGFTETVHVLYDCELVRLETLLTYFLRVIDPTSMNRQGHDRGTQYRTGIYYKDEMDRSIIDEVLAQEQKKYSKMIVTEVLPLQNYYLAEEYHQNYLEKNPNGYCHIDFSRLED